MVFLFWTHTLVRIACVYNFCVLLKKCLIVMQTQQENYQFNSHDVVVVVSYDTVSGPKWRLVSTRDPTIVYLPKSISKVTILDRKDDVIDCHLMQIEFKDGESPLEDGKTKYVSCFPSDELLSEMSRVFHGSERLKASGRGGRGRGRGRGGRGRGRGGGGRGRGRSR